MFQGEIPRGFIQTGKDGLRNQAGYDAVMDAYRSGKSHDSNRSTPNEGSGFGVFALILAALFSRPADPESKAAAAGKSASGSGCGGNERG
jgi:hypothetical protein